MFKPADKLTLILGVETFDKDRQKAIQNNAVKMKAVIEALKTAGLSKEELQTKDFVLIPQMTPQPKNPPADWQPTIAGYQVRNTLIIKTVKLDSTGEFIDTVTKVGGNYIQSISFSLLNDEEAKIEAIEKAYKQANTYAKALAKTSGLQLGDIIELSISQPYMTTRSFKAERLGVETETPISPRDVEVSASVSVIYKIETQNKP
ncbi:MAG: SIMPL domain-containing protein [Parachlamydiaceae bacterium]|nr:MAG: SIMPL domain-containing protein [Parachlamydiaceae bacterium]